MYNRYNEVELNMMLQTNLLTLPLMNHYMLVSFCLQGPSVEHFVLEFFCFFELLSGATVL